MKNFSIKSILLLGVAFIIICAFLHIVGIGCPIRFLTGISCAGCGMSRAYWCVLHLDFSTAFHYHPLWPLAPVLVLIFLLQHKLGKKIFTISLIAILAIFIIIYIIRLISPEDTIVIIDTSQSAMVKLLKMFRRILGYEN